MLKLVLLVLGGAIAGGLTVFLVIWGYIIKHWPSR